MLGSLKRDLLEQSQTALGVGGARDADADGLEQVQPKAIDMPAANIDAGLNDRGHPALRLPENTLAVTGLVGTDWPGVRAGSYAAQPYRWRREEIGVLLSSQACARATSIRARRVALTCAAAMPQPGKR